MNLKDISFDFNGEDTSYLTHSIHPYPAKYPPQLPQLLLKSFSKKEDIILDPFCGSGTTNVEAKLNGLNSIGIDVNPLACLLSEVKSTVLEENQFNDIKKFVEVLKNDLYNFSMGEKIETQIKDFDSINHWFQENVIIELSYLLNSIEKIKDDTIKNFLKIVFSSIIVRVSNQESDTRFASITKNIKNLYTINFFLDKVEDYTEKLKLFSKNALNNAYVKIYNTDSRNLNFLGYNTVDMIITSPPYANTYDYYLYHKFRKKWLDLDVKYAQNNEIGSRREYSSLKKKANKWIDDLTLCFKEMNKVMKLGGFLFIVIGDSVINKKLIKIDEYIKDFSGDVGFEFKDIISSDLSAHSRIFNPNFAQKGKKEHLIFLIKKYDRD